MAAWAGRVQVDLTSAELCERLRLALDSLPSPAAASERPLAIITGANGPSQPTDLPSIRLWSRGRAPGDENPFRDERTRHVLGAAPRVEPSHLADTLDYLSTGRFIDLERLTPNAVARVQFTLERSEERIPLLDAAVRTLAQAGVPPRLVEELRGLIDELLLNALYDAPVCGEEHLYALTSRRTLVPCLRPVELVLSVNDETVGVAVRDRFGSLSAAQILARLGRCFEPGASPIEPDTGGAGLGLFLLLAASSRLVFNINAGVGTEVIFARALKQRGAEFQTSAPSLNICEPQPAAVEAPLSGPQPAAVEAPLSGPQPVAVEAPLSEPQPAAVEAPLSEPHAVAVEAPLSEPLRPGLAAMVAVDGTTVGATVVELGEVGAVVLPFDPIRVEPGMTVRLTIFDSAVYTEPEGELAIRVAKWEMRPLLCEVEATVLWVGMHECGHGFGVRFAPA